MLLRYITSINKPLIWLFSVNLSFRVDKFVLSPFVSHFVTVWLTDECQYPQQQLRPVIGAHILFAFQVK